MISKLKGALIEERATGSIGLVTGVKKEPILLDSGTGRVIKYGIVVYVEFKDGGKKMLEPDSYKIIKVP